MVGESDPQPLDPGDAMAFLATHDFGRVAVSIASLPAVVAVHYELVDDAIVFAAERGSRFAAAVAGAVVAFEVDDYDPAARTGRSVVAVGRASAFLATPRHAWGTVLGSDRSPPADLVRLRPCMLSGRTVGTVGLSPAAGALAAVGAGSGRRSPSPPLGACPSVGKDRYSAAGAGARRRGGGWPPPGAGHPGAGAGE